MLAAPIVPLVLVGGRDCAVPVSWGRLWTCSTAANRRLKPLPTSPACAWTPPLVNRLLPAGRARTVGLRGKANDCRRRTHPSTIPVCPGPPPRWTGATATTRTVELTSPTAVWYRAGRPPVPLRRVLVREPQGGSPHRVCCAPTWPWTRCGFRNGLCCAGNWRSLFSGCGLTWAWRPKASERTEPLPVQRQPSWGSSPGSPWRLTCWGNSDPRPIAQRLVRQAVADLRGCHGPGAPPPVAGVGGIFTVRRRH